jgi:glycosyltransferase involved in cell wall biosynthesis
VTGKKILIFTSYLGSGGAEKHVVRLANELANNGWHITIVTPPKVGEYEVELSTEITLRKVGLNLKFSGFYTRLSGLPGLKRIIKKEKPDIIYSVLDIHNLILLKAIKGISELSARVVIGVQNSIKDLYTLNSPTHKFVRKNIPTLYPIADAVISLSHGVAKDLIEICPAVKAKVSVIHNIGLAPDLAQLSKATSPIKIPEGINLVSVGRLNFQKGQSYLLEAFSKVLEKKPECNLILLGEGELKADLENRAKELGLDEKVSFVGFHKNPFAIVAKCDLFVLSSLFEGFGNVIVEAMSVGVPVVSTDCPHGPNEIIRSSEEGVLVPIKDSGKLAEGILSVLNNPEYYAQLSKNGLIRSQNFDAKSIALQHMTLFEALINT